MARRRLSASDADPERSRRAVLRRASLYTVVFAVAGVAVAAAGTALVALLLRLNGLPFLRTWLVLCGLVIAAAIVVLIVQNLRERGRGRES